MKQKMNMLKQLTFLFLALLTSTTAFGQAEMADTLRSEGKIYVVVAIIVIVLVGVFAYLFAIDRKIKKLEDRVDGKP